jgi:hypothetical protein
METRDGVHQLRPPNRPGVNGMLLALTARGATSRKSLVAPFVGAAVVCRDHGSFSLEIQDEHFPLLRNIPATGYIARNAVVAQEGFGRNRLASSTLADIADRVSVGVIEGGLLNAYEPLLTIVKKLYSLGRTKELKGGRIQGKSAALLDGNRRALIRRHAVSLELFEGHSSECIKRHSKCFPSPHDHALTELAGKSQRVRISRGMAELTFSDVVNFLADHEGKPVYVEMGTRDPHNPEHDLFMLKLHGKKLGAIQDGKDYSTEERRAVMVRLHPREEPVPEDEREQVGSRLFINPAQVTKIQGDPSKGIKVWIEDTFYIGINSS